MPSSIRSIIAFTSLITQILLIDAKIRKLISSKCCNLFVEFVEFVHELGVGGAVVHLFEEGGVGSAEGLEHGYAAAAEGLGLLYLYSAFYVDAVVGGLGRGVG